MVLKKGSKGSAVTSLQQQLIDRGFLDGPADGDFGDQTRSAVRAFQASEGLNTDGLAGPDTLRALGVADAGGSEAASRDYHVTPAAALGLRPKLHAAGAALGLPSDFCAEALMSGDSGIAFGDYLRDNGTVHFSEGEVVTAHHRDKARQAGFADLTPPSHLWPWALLVLKLGDAMRNAVGVPVTLRNLYRPMSYNRLVATSGITSDHPNSAAGDFDFSAAGQRRTAEDVIRGLAAEHPELEVSMGLGQQTLHVGCLSPKGSRSWFYDGYADRRRPFP